MYGAEHHPTLTAQPDRLTEAPDPPATRLLEDVIGVLRLAGAFVLRTELTAPWAYESPTAAEIRAMLGPDVDRILLFHTFPEGRCTLSLASGESVELEAGDVVVLPYADQHTVRSHGHAGEPVPIRQLLPPQPWDGLPVVRYGGGGAPTRMVCGYLRCDDLLFNPFLRALPRVFRVRPPDGPASDWLRATQRYALEGASPAASQRLHELIFVEVMRLYVERTAPEQTGWLAALADPIVGRALLHVHRAPGHDWTVASLAARAGTSRSILDDRFRKLLGRAPMRYVAEWRLQLAAHLLRTTALGLAEIGGRVGYESEAAFNRAFRRQMGSPPARWRSEARERAT
jgi:AraC-like DNA-binding protein